MTAERRFAEIDALKTAGIATIILIHCVRAPWDPLVSGVEVWIGHVTRFGVPAFLMASGFLYAAGPPAGIAMTMRRLRRILVPYLLVSIAAQLWWWSLGVSTETGNFWLDIALGASMGPYYYVFVITGLVLLTPLIGRLDARLLAALTLLLVVAQFLVDAARAFQVIMFWHYRSPLLWWGYFGVGWLLRLHRDAVIGWMTSRRSWLLPALATSVVTLAALSAADLPDLVVRSAMWLNVYAISATIVLIASGRETTQPWLKALSDATYAIFLLHLFFVYSAQQYLPHPPGQAAFAPVVLPWLAGLLGPLIVIQVVRQFLGDRSRNWIGA
jgi:surface polysaccharide O-acyltransferase-like enzyme